MGYFLVPMSSFSNQCYCLVDCVPTYERGSYPLRLCTSTASGVGGGRPGTRSEITSLQVWCGSRLLCKPEVVNLYKVCFCTKDSNFDTPTRQPKTPSKEF